MRIAYIYNIVYKTRYLYVGSTWNYKRRLRLHKADCYNPNRRNYNNNLYKFIRATDVWSEFRFNIMDTIETDDSDEDGGLNEILTAEQYYIDMIEPILNDRDAITSSEERRRKKKEYDRNLDKKTIEAKCFSCEPCGYAGRNQRELYRHYTSNKHKNKINNIN
jgi:hypothetical protein